MRSTVWRGALVAGLAAAGAGGLLAAPSGASPQYLGPVRDWHGVKIQNMDPVPAQFQQARVAASRRAVAHSAAAQPASTTTSSNPVPPVTLSTKVLSNEKTFTRWAYTSEIVWIHKSDSSSSGRIVKTRWYTPDGFPELYVLLRQTTTAQGQTWIKLRIPGRPNGRVGWVPRSAVGNFHLTHQLIVVNRKKTRMYVYSRGRKVWSAPVGVGKRSTPTPPGHFWIDERFKISNPKSGYYPYAFGTTDFSTLTDWPGGGVVGIHGPYYDPAGIPGHISHGCIRLKVAADRWLAHHVGLGVPVHVV